MRLSSAVLGFILFAVNAMADKEDMEQKDCHHLLPFLFLLSEVSVCTVPALWTLLAAGVIIILVPTIDTYFNPS